MNSKAARYLQLLPKRTCVYCRNPASTRDHVVAGKILITPLPLNLPTVPSCDKCNGAFSKDEQYFIAVLGMIGRTPEIEGRIAEGADIYRTLERSSALDDRLISSVLIIGEPGIPPVFQVEEHRLAPLFQKMAFGLFLATYRPKLIPKLEAFRPLRLGDAWQIQRSNITSQFQQRRWQVLQENVFEYVFFKSQFSPYIGNRYCVMRFYGSTFSAVVQCPRSICDAST